jgi:hypothetical protein
MQLIFETPSSRKFSKISFLSYILYELTIALTLEKFFLHITYAFHSGQTQMESRRAAQLNDELNNDLLYPGTEFGATGAISTPRVSKRTRVVMNKLNLHKIKTPGPAFPSRPTTVSLSSVSVSVPVSVPVPVMVPQTSQRLIPSLW